jgi:23S rRNA pseudouridine2605 synthase
MRLNQYLAKHTELSRRSADTAIADGRVIVNGKLPEVGQQFQDSDVVELDGVALKKLKTTTIMLNKPIKTICSKVQQGNVATVYSLLPEELQHLTYVGRLDKDTSGLLIMSNDGDLIQAVTHPSHQVIKQYEAQLPRVLRPQDLQALQAGVELKDGLSKLELSGKGREWVIKIHEGRNRQIRRTFEALGYELDRLHRSKVGKLTLGILKTGEYKEIGRRDVL